MMMMITAITIMMMMVLAIIIMLIKMLLMMAATMTLLNRLCKLPCNNFNKRHFNQYFVNNACPWLFNGGMRSPSKIL